MTIPRRIQRKRTKGSRLPANTVCVSRPGRWSNPAIIGEWFEGEEVEDNLHARTIFEDGVKCGLDGFPSEAAIKYFLAGKNLACWCKLCPKHESTGKPLNETCADCSPCHVDPLGRIANGFECEGA